MITKEQKNHAYNILRAAGLEPAHARELLCGPGNLRDGFAGRAMANLMANADITDRGHRRELAVLSYHIADEMMIARAELPE